jgi:hypothetical protein
VYADLEFLGLEADSGLAVDALVRGGPGGPGTLVFHGERPSVEVEIDARLSRTMSPSAAVG